MFDLKKLVNLIIIFLLTWEGFFINGKWALASSANHLVISEVQTQGVAANDEFVELYNPTAYDLDISSWSIQYKGANGTTFYKKNFSEGSIVPAYGFFLIGHNNYQGDVLPDMSHSSFSLASSGGTIYLVSSQDKLTVGSDPLIRDKVAYGQGDDPEGESAPAPESFGSIERKSSPDSTSFSLASGGEEELTGNSYDTDNNWNDFILQEVSCPQNSGSLIELLLDEEVWGTEEGVEAINEEPGEEELETSESEEEIVGGEDQSQDQVEAKEETEEDEEELENSDETDEDFSPEDEEDTEELEETSEENLEEAVEELEENNQENESEEPEEQEEDLLGEAQEEGEYDPQEEGGSLPEEEESQNNSNDLDQQNSESLENENNEAGEADEENFESTSYPTQIIINEVFPNPEGSDEEGEFIELKNLGDSSVDLAFWQIADQSNTYIISSEDFTNTIIEAQGFFMLPRYLTGLALNNSGEEMVKLLWPSGELVSLIFYTGAPENKSYSRDPLGTWQWTSEVTAGQENILEKVNQSPQAVIRAVLEAKIGQAVLFDGLASFDPDEDNLLYFWDFGDRSGSQEPTHLHIYKEAGVYEVTLRVFDPLGAWGSTQFDIKVTDDEEEEEEEEEDNLEEPKTEDENLETTAEILEEEVEADQDKGVVIETAPTKQASTDSAPKIIISEFLPNPKGLDQAEWIEIFNPSQDTVDLGGWQIDDQEGGSLPYIIPEGTTIKEEQYLVFFKEETKLALNNSFDQVRLINSTGQVHYEVDYQEVMEGFSYARDEEGDWSWTPILTPGGSNIIQKEAAVILEEIDSYEDDFWPEEFYQNSFSGNTTAEIIETTLQEVRRKNLGDKVKVKGLISAPPGILGSQIFYLAGSGIQVYMYKKDFPALELGDLVEVYGVLSQREGEARIKLSTRGDIKILEHHAPPQAQVVTSGILDEEMEGHLVSVEGEVLEIESNTFYLESNGQEIKVYFRLSTGIKKPTFTEGERLKVTGIVSQNKTGYRLLPRWPEDIEVLGSPNRQTSSDSTLLLTNPAPDRKKIIKYLLVTAGALMVILSGLAIKNWPWIKRRLKR